jgi:hypothetical protein
VKRQDCSATAKRGHSRNGGFAGEFRPRRDVPDWDILASAKRRNLRSPSHERSIRLMEEQFIHFPVRAEMELHPEALKLVDDEGSALVGMEFVGWLAPNCQHELSIVVLPDKRVVALWLNVPVQC